MGICISYEGRLDDPAKLDQMIGDLQKWARELGWRCDLVEDDIEGILLIDPFAAPRKGRKAPEPRLAHLKARGVYIQPPGTDTLQFICSPSGHLVHYMEVPREILTSPITGETHYAEMRYNFVKTTGEVASHIGVCRILRKLKEKYATRLKVKDDARYWETGSRSKLFDEHGAMSMVVSLFNQPKNATALLNALGLNPGGGEVEVLDSVNLPSRKPASKRARHVN